MAVDIDNSQKMTPDIEHRNHADEKSSDSDVANELAWTEAEEKQVRNKVSQSHTVISS